MQKGHEQLETLEVIACESTALLSLGSTAYGMCVMQSVMGTEVLLFGVFFCPIPEYSRIMIFKLEL